MSGGAPVAALPMYDGPQIAAANDALWASIAAHLRAHGVEAPERLARDRDFPALWRNPRLLFGQTCGYPYMNLNPAVEIIRASQALELASEIAAFINCGAVGRSSFASRAYASTAGFRMNLNSAVGSDRRSWSGSRFNLRLRQDGHRRGGARRGRPLRKA
jgi:hypothetical protein